MVSWRADDYDLAFGQQFLVGGTEGWALALMRGRDYALPQDVREVLLHRRVGHID